MVMNDAGLVVAAFLGIALTAGAIVRDTRRRLGLERRAAMSGAVAGE